MLQSVSWIAAVAAEATRRLNACAGDELKQFLRLGARLSAEPSPAILRRMRAMRIEEWSPAKEAQVLAFIVSRLCQMPCSTGTKPRRCNLKEVERNVAAFLYCRHRLSDMMSEEERKAASPTPGATWKYMILMLHWVLFKCDPRSLI